jgi:hypothetical protein
VGAFLGLAALCLALFTATTPSDAPETDNSEAFNYVLAGELSQPPHVRRISSPPSFQVVSATQPELALPPGVR